LDDAGQAVGADVGMSIGEDVGGGSVLAEDAEDALHVAAFFGTRIEFSVREGSGSAFSKGVVALAVYDVVTRDGCEVFFSCINITSALEDDGTYAEFYESEGCEESARACSYNDGLWGVGDIGIVDGIVGQSGGVLVDEDLKGEIDHHLSLTSIDASLEGSDGADLLGSNSHTLGNIGTKEGSVIGYLRENTDLEGSRH